MVIEGMDTIRPAAVVQSAWPIEFASAAASPAPPEASAWNVRTLSTGR